MSKRSREMRETGEKRRGKGREGERKSERKKERKKDRSKVREQKHDEDCRKWMWDKRRSQKGETKVNKIACVFFWLLFVVTLSRDTN